MTKKIFKYKIDPQGFIDGTPYCTVLLPFGAEVVHVGMSQGSIALWAFVVVENALVPNSFLIVPTGADVPEDAKYLGTVHQNVFVWHIFQK